MKASITRVIKNIIQTLAIATFWLLIWQLTYTYVGRELLVPSPISVFDALIDLLQQVNFWRTVLSSLNRVLLGLILATLLGIVTGVLSGLSSWVYKFLNPFMISVKSTPVLSFIILALLWFKSTHVPIFICVLMCYPIIWTNVVTGIKKVDVSLIEMARVYRVHTIKRLRQIYWPSIQPYLRSALITSLGLGWKVSVAAEVLSHPKYAIGSELHSAKAYLDTPSLFAWTLVVIILSLFLENLLIRLVNRFGKWRGEQTWN
jgi:NitT/TauT family transport system permease protein